MLGAANPAVNVRQGKSALRAVPPLDTTKLGRELLWAALNLAQVRTTIQEYSILKEEYLNLLLTNRFVEAILTLNKIDKIAGASLWSVENRIALLGQAHGFHEQRGFVQTLGNKYKKSFLSFFAANVSERNETSVSLAGYEIRLRSRATHWDVEPSHKRYIFYKLLGELPQTETAFAEILAFEAASSPIDLYETFLSIISSLADRPDRRGIVLEAVEILFELNSKEMSMLRILLDLSPRPAPTASPQHLEHYLAGRLPEAAELAKRDLDDSPVDGLALIILSYIQALGAPSTLPRGSIPASLIELHSKLLTHSEESDDAAAELEKVCLNFRSLPYSMFLRRWLKNRQLGSVYKFDTETLVRGGVPVSMLRPELLLLENQGEKSPALIEYLRLEQGQETRTQYLSPENATLAITLGLRGRRKHADALLAIDGLENSKSELFRLWGRVLHAWLLFEDGDVENSIEASVDIAVEALWMTTVLPLMNAIKTRGFKDLKAMQRRASLPIAFFLYGHFARANDKDVALKVSWKQFLKAHGVTLPSAMPGLPEDQNSAHVIFFLRNVCSQEVMEMGVDFRSPQDLDRERLRICVMLSHLDTDNSTLYEEEIIELNRRLSIEEGVKQVESSRVYVDVLGLERWCFTNLNETFLRYLAYAGDKLAESVNEVERGLQVILKSRGNIREISDYLANYDITADSLLADFIEECCTGFMTLPRHGLDAFLGSRVRHGSLEGVFRSPLESARLVTKKSASTGDYTSNSFWIDEIQDPSAQSRADSLLRSFSRSIDDLLDKAVTELLYVRTDAKQHGLIWMFGTEEERRQHLSRWVINAKFRLSQGYSLEQLVRYCAYDLFWPTLSRNLDLVQDYMRSTLSGEICRRLDELSASIQPGMAAPQVTAFRSHVHTAKDSINAAGEKLASWFHVPSEPEQLSAYDLRTAMEIGIGSVRTIRPGFDPDVAWSIDPRANIVVHREALEIINDAAYLIFGNISKHSGFVDSQIGRSTASQVDIAIEWVEPNAISVTVISDVSPLTDLAIIEEKVSKAKAEIQARKFEEATKRTKGSGLVRLAFLLNHEGSADRSVDFGLQSDRKFLAKFSVPVYMLKLERD
ncbi:hypothetical protein OOZ63_23885 [Paucibacter sp. PLA-PC-4]|nr:hypothetical protein [Paucibacter sp. PLA-PC-4]